MNHDTYNDILRRQGKHERAIKILKLKIEILENLDSVKENREKRDEILSRLWSACECNHPDLQRELSSLKDSQDLWGEEARHLLLAYGFLRGKTYRQIENCTPGNEPNVDQILGHLPGSFTGELILEQQLEEWLPKVDSITEYLLEIPRYYEDDLEQAHLNQRRALKAWGRLRDLEVSQPQASWGPNGSIMFLWKRDDLHLELEFKHKIELFLAGESDDGVTLAEAITQIQTILQEKEAA